MQNKKYRNHIEIGTFLGADGGTWTLTPLRALAPEASASADLDSIAEALGAEFVCSLRFADRTEI